MEDDKKYYILPSNNLEFFLNKLLNALYHQYYSLLIRKCIDSYISSRDDENRKNPIGIEKFLLETLCDPIACRIIPTLYEILHGGSEDHIFNRKFGLNNNKKVKVATKELKKLYPKQELEKFRHQLYAHADYSGKKRKPQDSVNVAEWEEGDFPLACMEKTEQTIHSIKIIFIENGGKQELLDVTLKCVERFWNNYILGLGKTYGAEYSECLKDKVIMTDND